MSPKKFALKMMRMKKKRFRADADQYLHYDDWENRQRYVDFQKRARKSGQSNPLRSCPPSAPHHHRLLIQAAPCAHPRLKVAATAMSLLPRLSHSGALRWGVGVRVGWERYRPRLPCLRRRLRPVQWGNCPACDAMIACGESCEYICILCEHRLGHMYAVARGDSPSDSDDEF